jgi:hypothetical protein
MACGLLEEMGMSTRTSFCRPLLASIVTISAVALAACTTTITQFDDDGGSGGSGGAGPQCEGFDDTTERTDVTVTLRNERAEPVFLTGLGCESDIDLRLYDDDGERMGFRGGACHFTCEDLQETDGVCAADCAAPPIVMIAPGGSYELAWSGTVLAPEEMPSSCYYSPEWAAETCDLRAPAPAGTYRFEVTGYDDSWCPLDEPGACNCTPNADGNCNVEQYTDLSAAEGAPVSATLAFPSETATEIVFE